MLTTLSTSLEVKKMEVIGSVVSGSHGQILLRQKGGTEIELGDLLKVRHGDGSYSILQAYDLQYGSQIDGKQLELVAGMKLEGFSANLDFMDPRLRNYVLASVKSVLIVNERELKIPKTLPPFFGEVERVKEEDLAFLTEPKNPIYLGNVRSGSKVLGMEVYLNGEDMFRHHVLISATTGRGKSNLVKVMLWSTLGKDKFGILVLDPHDEYYGRHGVGLKNHPQSYGNLVYYSSNAPQGARTLLINLASINPSNLEDIESFSDAQRQALEVYHNHFGDNWIEQIVRGVGFDGSGLTGVTLPVLGRKLKNALGLYVNSADELVSRNDIFSNTAAGRTTVNEIVGALESGKIVIIDTSRLLDQAELLVGSLIVSNIFWRYQNYKSEGSLETKPIVSVVIEEAPRVLSAEKLTTGNNIYSTIAREGRKFKVGLLAITQLTSVIPHDILANLNTKIILGNELTAERKAVIDCACQDLSSDDRAIASLDKGEAIVSSTFTKFAVPIQIPKFDDFVKKELEQVKVLEGGQKPEKLIFR
jgi:hypothetical protein